MKNKVNNKSFLYQLLRNFRTHRELWIICIPIILWAIIFCYLPMGGIIIAFFDYVPGKSLLNSNFVGLKHFANFLQNDIFLQLLRNTLVMSILNLTLGFLAPIVFSLLLNEFHFPRGKKAVQTVSYLPHFVSWVVVGSIAYTLLSSEGSINSMLMTLGLITKPIAFLTTGKYYWAMYTIVNIWKTLGWSSIVYLSAITSVDPNLMEAAAIDGAGRFRLVIHVTLPAMLPTIILLWILGIGNILNAGFDQHLILGNPSTQQYWEVIDTYAYRYGVQNGNYSMATAVSLMKSVIGFFLVFITNQVSKKKFETALF